VVVPAAREDHTLHPIARPWFEQLQRDHAAFCVPDGVWVSFVRVTTNRRIFRSPSSLDEAFGFVAAVRAQDDHVTLRPGTRHLELFERVCREGDATGDLVPDAQLAALAIEHGAELVSFDRDFARFPGLRWVRPS
jgi:toxin-antitoxin system PIN domain toxin